MEQQQKQPALVRDLILKNRTRRRFHERQHISVTVLTELVDLARLSPSAGNKQPLKYMLSSEPRTNALVFECVAWAGYLKDWGGPAEGERPSSYIIILCDTSISKSCDTDAGIAAQSILLGATEQGLGGCIMGAVNREKLRAALAIDARYDILLVLAIGRPKETVVLETMKEDDCKYWRDEAGVHHVPKRPMKEVLL